MVFGGTPAVVLPPTRSSKLLRFREPSGERVSRALTTDVGLW